MSRRRFFLAKVASCSHQTSPRTHRPRAPPCRIRLPAGRNAHRLGPDHRTVRVRPLQHRRRRELLQQHRPADQRQDRERTAERCQRRVRLGLRRRRGSDRHPAGDLHGARPLGRLCLRGQQRCQHSQPDGGRQHRQTIELLVRLATRRSRLRRADISGVRRAGSESVRRVGRFRSIHPTPSCTART